MIYYYRSSECTLCYFFESVCITTRIYQLLTNRSYLPIYLPIMLKLKLELTEQFLCNRTRMINYLLYISICDIFKELQLDILCGLSNIFTFTYIYIYTVKHTHRHTQAHIYLTLLRKFPTIILYLLLESIARDYL